MTTDLAFTTFPVLTTTRLLLRQARPEDAPALFATFSDEETMRYYGREPMRTMEEAQQLVAGMADRYARRAAIRWCLTLKGEEQVIGSCGCHEFDQGFHRAEIGYEINRAYWRQGLMSEAVAAMLTYGFGELGLHRVEAMIDMRNEASRRLLLKLGFTYEGTLRERYAFGDTFGDESCFSVLQREWREQDGTTRT